MERGRKKKRISKVKGDLGAKNSLIYKDPLNGLDLVKTKLLSSDGQQAMPKDRLDLVPTDH